RMMPYRNLFDHRAPVVGEDRHETMDAIERGQQLNHRTLEGPQVASGVQKIYPQNQLPRRSRDGRRTAPDKTICPLRSHSARHVAVGQLLDQSRQVRWVILKVAIQRRDDRSAARLESGP